MNHCRAPSAEERNIFNFDPFSSDICIGSFSINSDTLRQAFAELGACYHFYECRFVHPEGGSSVVGLMDPRRQSLEAVCRRYGEGKATLADFQDLVEPKTGFILNSMQNVLTEEPWAFNRIADEFVSRLGYRVSEFPEELDIAIFFGTYDAGFGMHGDASDVALFVLDGKKNFLIETEGLVSDYVVSSGNYLRWTSHYMHGSSNPDGNWSMSMHISVGPSMRRNMSPGTPVDYIYPKTKLKNLLDFL